MNLIKKTNKVKYIDILIDALSNRNKGNIQQLMPSYKNKTKKAKKAKKAIVSASRKANR